MCSFDKNEAVLLKAEAFYILSLTDNFYGNSYVLEQNTHFLCGFSIVKFPPLMNDFFKFRCRDIIARVIISFLSFRFCSIQIQLFTAAQVKLKSLFLCPKLKFYFNLFIIYSPMSEVYRDFFKINLLSLLMLLA